MKTNISNPGHFTEDPLPKLVPHNGWEGSANLNWLCQIHPCSEVLESIAFGRGTPQKTSLRWNRYTPTGYAMPDYVQSHPSHKKTGKERTEQGIKSVVCIGTCISMDENISMAWAPIDARISYFTDKGKNCVSAWIPLRFFWLKANNEGKKRGRRGEKKWWSRTKLKIAFSNQKAKTCCCTIIIIHRLCKKKSGQRVSQCYWQTL